MSRIAVGSSQAKVHSPAKRRKLSPPGKVRRNNRSSINENARRASFFSRHSQSIGRQTTVKEAIVIEDSPTYPIPANDPIWIKNEHMILYERDHQILLNDRWLNDAIVNAAQPLLKYQFHTAGLLDVCAMQTLAVDIQHGEFCASSTQWLQPLAHCLKYWCRGWRSVHI